MKQKIKIYILFTICLIVASLLFFIFLKNIEQYNQSGPDYTTHNLNAEYNLFVDKKYQYQFAYPKNLNSNITNNPNIKTPEIESGNDIAINRAVSFMQDNGGPWAISLFIYKNTRLKSIDEWFAEQNEFYKETSAGNVEVVIEKRIKIDGADALVTYLNSKEELMPYNYEKTTIFIKDEVLFELSTRSVDHQKIWDSFKFIK